MTSDAIPRRQALRAAIKIHEHLAGPGAHLPLPELPHYAWEQLVRSMERLAIVRKKKWPLATQSLLTDLEYALRYFQREIESFRTSLPRLLPGRSLATAGEIASDLVALASEFEELSIEPSHRTVSVLTQPITLEEVPLGRFRIELTWTAIGRRVAYECQAQSPHPPCDREDVTHPHVINGTLCEGEGAEAIQAALTSGRFYDFFLLVRQILGTYNAQSAHVLLAQWQDGSTCRGCGSGLSQDDTSCCERCDETFCSDCIWICQDCSRTVCSDCSGSCAHCDDRFCDQCLRTATDEAQQLCPQCLKTHHEQQLSQDSHDDVPDDTSAEETPAQALSPPSPVALEPVCLGQAAVPA